MKVNFYYFWAFKSGSSSVVEHQLPKLRVAGSIPVSRSLITRELNLFLALFILIFKDCLYSQFIFTFTYIVPLLVQLIANQLLQIPQVQFAIGYDRNSPCRIFHIFNSRFYFANFHKAGRIRFDKK